MWINPDVLRQSGIPVLEVDVKEGEAIWVPYNLPHMVLNTETLTVAFAYNILLPQTLQYSFERLAVNRKFNVHSKVVTLYFHY